MGDPILPLRLPQAAPSSALNSGASQEGPGLGLGEAEEVGPALLSPKTLILKWGSPPSSREASTQKGVAVSVGLKAGSALSRPCVPSPGASFTPCPGH